MAALALLVTLAIPMGVWGQTRSEVTYTFSDHYSANTTLTNVAIAFDNSITGTFDKGEGSTAPQYYTNGTAVRWYGGNTLAITASNATISEIVLTYTQKNKTVTTNVGTYNHDNGTWSGSASSVTFTVETGSGHNRVSAIKVTYSASGSTSTCATPTFNPAAGTYTEAQSVSINCETSGATIYYTIDGTAPTTLSSVYSSPLTISETTTVKAMAAAANYENSSVATATYNIVEPLTTMDAIFAAATEAGTTATPAVVTFNNWVVTGVKNSNAYVTDGTKGFIVYTSGHGFEVGNVLSGTASCNVQLYKGAAEITGLTSSTTGLTVTTGGTVTPVTNISIADLSGVNTGAVFSYENLTYDGNYLVDGNDNALKPFNSLYTYTFVTNKVYNVTGVFVQYDSDKEILPRSADDIEEVVVTVPSITFNPDVVNLDAAQQTIQIPFTYENIVVTNYQSFTVHYYDANGEEIQLPETPWYVLGVTGSNDEGYNLTGLVTANEGEARSAFMKVSALDAEENVVYSNLITINQAQYVVDYATLPFEFDGGRADIAVTNGLTHEYLGSDYSNSPKLKFDQGNQNNDNKYSTLVLKFNERPGTLTFDLKANPGSNGWSGTFTVQTSEDGETYTDLATYTDISTNGQSEEFTNLGENVRYIKWIYTEKVNGNVALGNIVLDEYTGPVASITVADATVSVPAEGAEGTLTVTYENITEIIADVYFCDADGQEFTYEWMTAEIDDDNNVEYLVEPNEGKARTAYFKVYAMDDEGELVYSNIVTVSQDAPVVPPTPGNWVLTDLTDLTENDVFVIVGDNGDTYAMPVDGGGQSGAPAAVAVTVVEGTLSGEPAANLQWNIRITEDGYTFYPNGETETWLYCTNTNNGVRVGTGDAKHFTLDEGYLTTTETTDQRYIGIYNSQDWRCYKLGTDGTFPANIADQTFAFYKKVAEPITETYTLEIAGYEAGSDGGYYLIASPVTVNPANVEGMTTGEYDLYSFDQAEADEWRNYKVNAFNLEPGKGYLYAKQATEPDEVFHFELTGTPYNGEPITLSKSENVDFPGWNLVGNPFGQTAYIDRDFYVMKLDGSEIIESETNEIAVMQGVFVIAANDGEELTFSTEAPTTTDGKIVMNVNSNRGNIIDRAMIRFGEGRQLPKFMLNEDNTKLYIAKGEEEYAVARNEAKGEMNLNFEAAEDGTYTLDFTVENVELDQLLLIDDKTGVSIDLLCTQSYTFEATTDDAAARFRIVFGATTSVQEENINKFAFYNNGNLIINNNGNAILNIVDVLGRIISSYNINGSENVSINAKAGVYMLQLIQGDKIQTQKIVVE